MNKKKYYLKNRTRFFSFIFAISLVIFVMIYTANVSGYHKQEYISVTVNSGDTLWSIAERYCDDNHDIRKYIYEIKDINNMDSGFLMADSSILVPVD